MLRGLSQSPVLYDDGYGDCLSIVQVSDDENSRRLIVWWVGFK